MRRSLAFEILVVSLIWLVAFWAIAIPLAHLAGGHGAIFVVYVALMFGVFGAVVEAAYSIIERVWKRPTSPRWLLVAAWTLVVPNMALLALALVAVALGNGFINIEAHEMVFLWSIVPVFAVAYVASWPFRLADNSDLPVRWQGWLVLGIFVLLLVLGSFLFPPRTPIKAYLVYVGLLSALLCGVFWLKVSRHAGVEATTD